MIAKRFTGNPAGAAAEIGLAILLASASGL